MTHEINIYPKTRLACRQESVLKNLKSAAKTRISNEDQYSTDLDLGLANGMLSEPIALAAREIKIYAREEFPTHYHEWLNGMDHFPRLSMYRVIAELGAAIDIARGPRSLRHICGIFPHNGKAIRTVRGQKATFNPSIKGLFLSPKKNGLMTQIRLHRCEPWLSIWEERKTYLASRLDIVARIEAKEKGVKSWIDSTARRMTAQKLLNELWEVAHLGMPRRWMDNALEYRSRHD